MKTFAKTHIGLVRKQNEDAIYLSGEQAPLLAVVADGMGGHAAGDVASGMAIDRFAAGVPLLTEAEDHLACLEELSRQANREIWEKARTEENLSSMGTTVVAAWVQDSTAYLLNVGDSRAYLVHDGALKRITKDHSLVQQLIDAGIISPETAAVHPNRNIITRALGMENVVPSCYTAEFIPGDLLLLCSDGISGCVPDEAIEEILSDGSLSVADKGEKLLQASLDAGGRDNASLILVFQEVSE